MTSKQIRQQFLDFFRGKQHEIVASSPVVPFDDPTLMFTNAGMNQFKDVFLGTGSRPYRRAADTQKCIRAGGKHNDLDDVGQDTYHHTFFEMLGNWSFGDYFKKEAIEWAWELLTKVWKIDKSRLHATYFGGLKKQGNEATRQQGNKENIDTGASLPGCLDAWELEPDYEARDLWASVTDIDPTHIHPGNMKDNFWEMGDTGPCGPCSEIHIDLTPDKSGGHLVNKGDARVMEIWNLVFIQFNRAGDGKLSSLPAKHVDTGMGFERLCAVLQGAHAGRLGRFSNYDTDVFTPVFEAIRKRTGAPQYTGTLPGEPRSSDRADLRTSTSSSETESPRGLKSAARSDQSTFGDQLMIDVSYRVIADHVRCLTFALTDGALPSNEGRGYVLRRILRRAVRYGRQYLNMHEPFLCDLVAPLVEHMGEAFPELRTGPDPRKPRDNVKHVADILRDEEASFLKTLDRGISLFNDFAAMARAVQGDSIAKKYLNESSPGWDHPDNLKVFREAGANVFPGKAIFILHDTYGFPADLTEIMTRETGLVADVAGYEDEMTAARKRARAGAKATSIELVIEGSLGSTGDELKYWEHHCNTQILGYVIGGTIFTKDAIPQGVELAIITKDTCFYAEQGGQVGDSGFLQKDGIKVFRIKNAKYHGDAVLHIGQIVDDSVVINVGDSVWLEIDDRKATKQNHTATHVLNWALREVLEIGGGGKVDQKGSLVDPEKTRFDFSHNKPLTDNELDRVESLCNERIAQGLAVYAAMREEDFVDQAEARKINTLRAVFGEKYPDRVRVVSIGAPITEEDARQASNRESARTEVRGSQGAGDSSPLQSRDRKGAGAARAEARGSHATPLDPPLARGEAIETDWLLRDPQNPKWMKYSVEFCGGTHVKNTSEIERFVLTHEEGVAKGVRRVVGISGEKAKQSEARGKELLHEARSLSEPRTSVRAVSRSSTSPAESETPRGPKSAARSIDDRQSTVGDLAERVADIQRRLNDPEQPIPMRARRAILSALADVQETLKEQQKETAAASGEAVMEAAAKLFAEAKTIGGVTVVVGEVPTATADALRGAIDWIRQKTDASAVLLGCVSDGKVTLVAGMSKAVVDRGVKAGDLIKEICPLVGGRGGGRPDMAQGGGSDAAGLPSALQRAREWITERLG